MVAKIKPNRSGQDKSLTQEFLSSTGLQRLRLGCQRAHSTVVKVLLATDGSSEATTALETANRLIRPDGRHLDLLCVAPRRRKGFRKEPGKHGHERVPREITQILERARASVPSEGTAINLLAEIGSPSASIVRRVADYDLTVVGSRGHGTTSEVGLGPVASRVVEHGLGAILVARRMWSEGGLRILAAVDGSSAAWEAMATLGEVLNLSGAEVCLMHVIETPWTELGLEDDWVTYSDEDKEHSDAGAMENELMREGTAVLDQARDFLKSYDVSISVRMDEGNPANEILSEAERGQYDLIVVGATGARDLKHQMLGSVSFKIVWNASCSVLIVREPE